MAMVAVPVVFGFLGSLLDGAVGTAVLFTILFGVFGVACSLTAAWYRYERSIAQHEAGKPWTRTREVRRIGSERVGDPAPGDPHLGGASG